MLTRQYVLKVARLLEQTGEPRPGFLHDGAAKLQGHDDSPEDHLTSNGYIKKETDNNDNSQFDIYLDYEKDPQTGDIRIVVK